MRASIRKVTVEMDDGTRCVISLDDVRQARDTSGEEVTAVRTREANGRQRVGETPHLLLVAASDR